MGQSYEEALAFYRYPVKVCQFSMSKHGFFKQRGDFEGGEGENRPTDTPTHQWSGEVFGGLREGGRCEECGRVVWVWFRDTDA